MNTSTRPDWRAVAAERDRSAGLEAELLTQPRRIAFAPIAPAGRLRTCVHCGCQGGYYLQPVEGLDGKYECRREKACSKRIQRSLGVAA